MAKRKLGSIKAIDDVLITSVDLGTDVTSTLGVANGGTGQTTYTNGQLLIGNTTGNTLTKATLTQGNSIAITNGTGSITIAVSDGDKGDITVSGSGATWTVDNAAITYAKIQNVTTNKLLGRATAGSGVMEEITLGTGLSYTGTTLNVSAGTSSGSAGYVQYSNGSGGFSAEAGFEYNATLDTLTATNIRGTSVGLDVAGSVVGYMFDDGGVLAFTVDNLVDSADIFSMSPYVASTAQDKAFLAGGPTILNRVIAPAQLTANQNDYNPTGWTTAVGMALTSNATRTITGIVPTISILSSTTVATNGRLLFIHNIGSNNIVLADESASSTATNRFALSGDITLKPDQSCLLQYYGASTNRWKMVAHCGIIPLSQLGTSGTQNATTFLRGDNTWSNRITGTSTSFGYTSGAGTGSFTQSFGASGGLTQVTHSLVSEDGVASDSNVLVLSVDSAGTTRGLVTVKDVALSQAVAMSGVITPTALAANTDNWNPTGLATASVIRASASTSTRTLTGIVSSGSLNGRLLTIVNVGTIAIVLSDDATSTAANRFQIPGGDLTLRGDDDAAVFMYDTTVSRWRLVAHTGHKPSILTPSALGADQTDYNPSGLATAGILRLTTSGNNYAIKSINASAAMNGRILVLSNIGSTGNITLNHQDAAGTSTYQIRCPNYGNASVSPNFILAAGASVTLMYDSSLSKWIIQSHAGTIGILNGFSTPSAIASDTNDYAPSSQALSTVFRLSASTQERKITGITAPADGKVEFWANVGSVPIIFRDDNASSTAANRIAMPTDLLLLPDDAVATVYDATSARYRPLAALPINAPRVIHQDTTQTLFQSTTAEQTMMTCTVPAHWMGPEGGFDFVVTGLILNNHTASMTFTFRIKFGGTTLWSDVVTLAQHSTSHRPYEIRGYLNNIDSLTSQYLFSRCFIGPEGIGAVGGVGNYDAANHSAGGSVGNATSSADTKSNQTFEITCQMSVSGTNAQWYRTFSRAVLTRQV